MASLFLKEAVVTGAGAGIGLGCARELVRAGAHVSLCDTNTQLVMDEAIKINRDFQRDAVVSSQNIHDLHGRENLVQGCRHFFKQIDILVTGPASTVRKPALELGVEDYAQVFNDNCTSHVHLATLVAQDMIRRRSGGHIIFISSVYGSLVREGSAPYDIAKAGLNQATRVLAEGWAKYGILVNAIAPGFTDTPGERKLATDEEIDEVVGKIPLCRAGTPSDIGETAVWLASSQHVTGQIITVDGGHSLVDLYDKK